MNVLITGSNGFVGKSLVSYLKNNYKHFEVFGWLRSFGSLNQENFSRQFGENIKIDKLIHLACNSKVVESWDLPYDYYIKNTELTLDALEFCKTHKSAMIYISSYMYGNAEKQPISEEAPVKVNNPYAFSKLASENLCQFYADNHYIKTAIVRPFNIYGPGQSPHFIIPKIGLMIKDVSNLEIKLQNLNTRRDFIYIDDLNKSLAKILTGDVEFEVFNIGSGYSVSVKEIIDELSNISGIHKKVSSPEIYRKNEIMDVVADISKAKKLLNWSPEISLKQGLELVYKSL